jgi:selenium metabolism protein YedF
MIQVNAMGEACPIPVVKTKKTVDAMTQSDTLETLVDNEIAVQNLTKFAASRGFAVKSQKMGEKEYKVIIEVKKEEKAETAEEEISCIADTRSDTVVVISSPRMGEGKDDLGEVLMKGFIYALTQQDTLPGTILFYNGGAVLTCEGSPALEDLRTMEAQGVKILTCGTCLNYYGLTDKLAVGEVTNMYVIAETMTKAGKLVKP